MNLTQSGIMYGYLYYAKFTLHHLVPAPSPVSSLQCTPCLSLPVQDESRKTDQKIKRQVKVSQPGGIYRPRKITSPLHVRWLYRYVL